MTKLKKPPLIEAIFEIRWGETKSGEFEYSANEQTLFAGQISASSATNGYGITQIVNQRKKAMAYKFPMEVSHRFRNEDNSWPCFQVGLGIFTVNQIADGYDWSTFKDSIKMGLKIFNQAGPEKMVNVKDTLLVLLRYQDAFFPEEDSSVEEFIEKHSNINAGLPDTFLDNENIDRTKSIVNLKTKIDTNNPKGNIEILIANAIINDKPGLLMETVVSSKIKDFIGDDINQESILGWAEKAHSLQKHSFETLIEPSAYK